MREVVMFRHRADIRLAPGRVIEFQHSSLSVDEIWERERFYGPGLTWVFDTIEAVESERLHLRAKRGPHHRYRTFRWKHPRRSIIHCRRPSSTWVKAGCCTCNSWGAGHHMAVAAD